MGLDFFRRAGWLDAARARGYLRLVALLNLGALAFLLATSRGGIDSTGFLLGTDFLSFWTTGRMLQAGEPAYDVAAHIAAQRTYFAQKGVYTAFFYPPSFLPFCWPLGFTTYFPALAAWLAMTGAACLFAVRRWVERTGLTQRPPLLFAAFPPVLITIMHGQTSFLVAALLGLGALPVRDRPWLAGALFGLATVKPQFGLLVPIVLVLTREWRVVGGAAVGAAALALTSTLAFGPHVWSDWLHVSGSAQAAMANGAVGFAKMQSPFAAARLLGAAPGPAYALQGLLTLAVALIVARASWGRGYDVSLGALMLAGAPLATPFVLDYDMLLLGFPLIWLAAQGAAHGFRDWERLVLAVTFIAPVFARPLAMEIGVPIMPLVLIAFFAVLARRVRASVPAESR